VSSLASAAHEEAPVTRRALPRIWSTYTVLGLLLVAYGGALIVRAADRRSTLVDGWGVDVFELVVCALAVARAARLRSGRAVPLALGAAMSMWALGDVALTFESLHGAVPPSPSVADWFYLAFFPLAYLALVLMVRRESTRLVPAVWLDGLVAGLGAAALSATFAFHTVLHATGVGAAAAAINLAYPIGDVLLLGLVVGGSALVGGRRQVAWHLVAAGCALNAVGDTFNLLNSAGETHLGAVIDGVAWPAALLLMSTAVWVRAAKPDVLADRPAPGFLLPALGAAAALAVLLMGTIDGREVVGIALAAATLVVAGIRLLLSAGQLRRLTDERQRQAVTDQLTGLGNRRRLAQALERFFVDEADVGVLTPRPLAFLFVDLDHFKEVNDSFGHPAGDQLLSQIGPRIQGCLAKSDLLTRIGGDELAVVLFDTGPARATRVAARISAAIAEPFVLDMVSVQIAASIGIALAPDHATSSEALMGCADQAMYRAKQGGTSFEVYDAGIDSETDRLRLVEDLRAAIAEEQFELHYQPQIDLRTGTVDAVEALLRWPHPRLGLVPPSDFLPLAERAGLMRPLTRIVLDQALAQCARWHAEGQRLSVSINVSATNVLDAEFVPLVRRRLARHGLSPETLVLEITETTVISDFERCKRVIDELRDLGCVVSIDDFGAGFTSLAHLARLAIGELKLDRTFLSALTTDEHNVTLIRATIELAHSLGLQVVAEGVEEEATLETLGRIGCDLAQGYYIGRPAPAAALALPRGVAA
jgi:diguanylate cyclase (GGDEF)-like protein